MFAAIVQIFYVFFFLFCPQESEGFFLRALQINPNAASFHGNLGELPQLEVFFFLLYLADTLPKISNLKEWFRMQAGGV